MPLANVGNAYNVIGPLAAFDIVIFSEYSILFLRDPPTATRTQPGETTSHFIRMGVS